MVAATGQGSTCVRLGFATEARRDHALYIALWLKALRSNHHASFTAASKAQEAADYLVRTTGGDRVKDQESVAATGAKGSSLKL